MSRLLISHSRGERWLMFKLMGQLKERVSTLFSPCGDTRGKYHWDMNTELLLGCPKRERERILIDLWKSI